MEQKVSIVAGALVVVGAMAIAGVTINVSALSADQSAAVVQSLQAKPVAGVKERATSNVETNIALRDQKNDSGIIVPREALQAICKSLPAALNAIKNVDKNMGSGSTTEIRATGAGTKPNSTSPTTVKNKSSADVEPIN